jgi:peroxiredoxin
MSAKSLFIFSFLLLLHNLAMAQSEPKGLALGERAPDFEGVNQLGTKVNLQQLTKTGPVILLFYRGQWCPYCNKQLSQLQDSLYLVEAKGASVIAVTPEIPASIEKTVGKTKVSFSVLHDENLQIMKQYDVAFEVDAPTLKRYSGFGIDLMSNNGDNGPVLPVPAVYIIGRDGKVSYRYFNADYKQRVSVAELLNHL